MIEEDSPEPGVGSLESKSQVLSSRCDVLGATLLVRDWLVFNEPKRKRCLSLFSDQMVYAFLSLTSGAPVQ